MQNAVDIFPGLTYVGGGYYRLKGIPKGQSSLIIHGDDIFQVIMAFLVFHS